MDLPADADGGPGVLHHLHKAFPGHGGMHRGPCSSRSDRGSLQEAEQRNSDGNIRANCVHGQRDGTSLCWMDRCEVRLRSFTPGEDRSLTCESLQDRMADDLLDPDGELSLICSIRNE